MSDTLRERLQHSIKAMRNHTNWPTAADLRCLDCVLKDTITELDRLEADVKKPRLPEGYVLDYRKGSLVLVDPSGDSVSLSHDYDGLREEIFRTCFSAFLPTPDVVPSTRDLSIPKEWSERKGEEIGSDECAAGMLAADPFNTQAHASPSDQGQGSQTPMNTETAEKPKPVSLVEAFMSSFFDKSEAPNSDEPMTWGFFYWLLRTLDQERGV